MIKIAGFILFSLTLSASSFAAQVNLNGGEVVQIQPNVVTTVSCGATNSGYNCSTEEIQAALSVIDSCIKSSAPTSTCIRSFLQANPIVSCNQFRAACFTKCNATSVASQDCMNICSGR